MQLFDYIFNVGGNYTATIHQFDYHRQRGGFRRVLHQRFNNCTHTPSPLKGYVINKSSLLAGKQVLPTAIKIDEHDIQLTFGLHASSLAQFMMQYQ